MVKGDLDKEAGEIVATALHAMAEQLFPKKDDRKRSARHADALVEICVGHLPMTTNRTGGSAAASPT